MHDVVRLLLDGVQLALARNNFRARRSRPANILLLVPRITEQLLHVAVQGTSSCILLQVWHLIIILYLSHCEHR